MAGAAAHLPALVACARAVFGRWAAQVAQS